MQSVIWNALSGKKHKEDPVTEQLLGSSAVGITALIELNKPFFKLGT